MHHSKWLVRGHPRTQGIEEYWGHLKLNLEGSTPTRQPKTSSETSHGALCEAQPQIQPDFTELILHHLVIVKNVVPSK